MPLHCLCQLLGCESGSGVVGQGNKVRLGQICDSKVSFWPDGNGERRVGPGFCDSFVVTSVTMATEHIIGLSPGLV